MNSQKQSEKNNIRFGPKASLARVPLKEKKPLTSLQLKLIFTIAAIVGVALLYHFSLWFRINLPIIALFVVSGVLVQMVHVSQIRGREDLKRRIREALPKFEADKNFRGDGNRTGVMFDSKRFEFVAYASRGGNLGAFTYRDLIRSEVIEDGGSVTSTNRSSQLVGAVVGNALVGGLGMVIGGLSGKKQSQSNVSKVSVDVTVKNVGQPLWTVVLLDSKKPLLRSSNEVTNALKSAKDIHALLSVFIRKADDEDKSAQPIQTPISSASPVTPQLPTLDASSFSEELTKLAKLKEQGVLDDSEFIEMKKAVLERAKRHLAR